MVLVSGYKLRTAKDGHEFVSLELTGGIEFVQSMKTGKFYATARKCNMPGTFGEELAKAMVGSSFPGSIERVNCDPYNYVIKDTGEVITLAYQYEYVPEGKEQKEKKPEMSFEMEGD